MSSPRQAGCPPDAGRVTRRGPALPVFAVELLSLLALVIAEPLLERATRGTWLGRSALHYLGSLALAGGLGYVGLRLAVAWARRGRCARDLADDPERIPRTLTFLLAILLPFALLPEPAWWAVLGMGLGAVLVWLDYREEVCRPFPVGSAAPPEVAPEDVRLAPLRELAEARGVRDLTFVVGEGDDSLTAAYAPSRRGAVFYLSRGLFARCDEDERRVAFAHELAHCERGHSRVSLLLEAVLRLFATAGVCGLLALTGRAGSPWSAVRLAPAALLAWSLLRAVTVPLEKSHTRRQEREAHRLALEMTDAPAAFERLFRKIAEEAGAGAPGRLRPWLLDDAPSLPETLAIVRRYAAERDAITKHAS